jgi:hypothetical protein
MQGASGPPQPQSEFHVEKARTNATLTLSNGTSVRGSFFIAGSSATHSGPQRVREVLNAESGFIPFEVAGVKGPQSVLFNREHVVFVALVGHEEARLEPGYDIATRRMVSMLISNGSRLNGWVSVYRPQGRDRLSDFARSPDSFQYLESAHTTYLVNVRHLIELVEEAHSA